MNYSFNIYVPSYNRYDKILTKDLLEFCTYVVRKSQEQAYRDAGIEDIIAVDDNLIDSGMKAYDWIINNAEEDIFCIIDDDLEDFVYRLDENTSLCKDKARITSELFRFAQIMADLDIGFMCSAGSSTPLGYNQEFTFKGSSGGVKMFNKKVFKAKMDYNIAYNWDIDLQLQELLINRIILRPNYFVEIGGTDTNKGGDATNKTRQMQLDSLSNMKLKWGKYFDLNVKSNKPNIRVKR